jgi:hypothetical protein
VAVQPTAPPTAVRARTIHGLFEPVRDIVLAVEALRRAHADDPLVRRAGDAVDAYLNRLEEG